MKPFRVLSAIEQIAAYLRREIQDGSLGGTLPGVHRLAKELGVSSKSVVAAVAQLEQEGLLRGQGARRRCEIVPTTSSGRIGLRLRILLYEKTDQRASYMVDLQHLLTEAGHRPQIAAMDLHHLKMDALRVARHVKANPADAWIVCSGSREVLEWFAQQPFPSIAMFGRFSGLSIAAASPRKSPSQADAIRRLVALGHRKIVMLSRQARRKPYPGVLEQNFFHELEAHGLPTGSYNLPDWEDSPAGFRACLISLFRHTPPTALLVDGPRLFMAAQQYLARRGIHAPEQVSMICSDPNPTFDWCEPAISHYRWDHRSVERRVVQWAENVALGREDRRQILADTEFVEGGTIGPAV